MVILNSNEAKRSEDDSYEDMKTYAKEQGYNWYYLVDKNSSLADAFGANRTPSAFFLMVMGNWFIMVLLMTTLLMHQP